MAKIKYLVMGIESDKLGQMIGNLVAGEVEGPAEIVVLSETPPSVYLIDPAIGTAKAVNFDRFLSAVVAAERKRVVENGPMEKAVQDIVRFKRGSGSGSGSGSGGNNKAEPA